MAVASLCLLLYLKINKIVLPLKKKDIINYFFIAILGNVFPSLYKKSILETPPPRTIISGSKISTIFANDNPKFSINLFFQFIKFELFEFDRISGNC